MQFVGASQGRYTNSLALQNKKKFTKLPVFVGVEIEASCWNIKRRIKRLLNAYKRLLPFDLIQNISVCRSEERRVGKEGRFRSSTGASRLMSVRIASQDDQLARDECELCW